MASTFITNIILSESNQEAFIPGIEHVGAYIIKINCENNSKGTHAIFNLASSMEGQSRVKKVVSCPGSCGEELLILWGAGENPILTFEDLNFLPDEPQSYNLKII